MGLLSIISGLGISTIANSIKTVTESLRKFFKGEEISGEDMAKVKLLLIELERYSLELEHKALELQSKVVIAEAQGGSWLQRNWRPLTMCMFGLIIMNNYILNPWLQYLFSVDVLMDLPPEMWAMLKWGMGGYITGRLQEKILRN